MSRERIANIILLAGLFLLPFQTRWIFRDLTIGGEAWEYGRMSLYAVEILIFVAVLLRGKLQISTKLIAFQKPMAFLIGALLISASLSQNLVLALSSLQHVIAAIALFTLLVDERTDIRRAAIAFVAGLLIPSGLAWYQVVTGTSPSSSWLGLASHDSATLGASVVETATGRILRGYGTLPHPNIFGGYLAVGLIVCGWLAKFKAPSGASGSDRPKGRLNLVLAAPITVLASTLIITFSRGAWLATAIGFTALAIAMLFTRKSVPHHAIPLATLGLISLIATLAIFHVPAFTRFQPAARLEAKSLSERSTQYRVVDDIARMNLVTGVGPGNYTAALATLFPGRPAYTYQPIHNTILLFLAETGIIGLIALARFAFVTTRFARTLRPSSGALFSLSLISCFLVLGFFDHYLWSLWPGIVLASLGIGFSLKMTLDT